MTHYLFKNNVSDFKFLQRILFLLMISFACTSWAEPAHKPFINHKVNKHLTKKHREIELQKLKAQNPDHEPIEKSYKSSIEAIDDTIHGIEMESKREPQNQHQDSRYNDEIDAHLERQIAEYVDNRKNKEQSKREFISALKQKALEQGYQIQIDENSLKVIEVRPLKASTEKISRQ